MSKTQLFENVCHDVGFVIEGDLDCMAEDGHYCDEDYVNDMIEEEFNKVMKDLTEQEQVFLRMSNTDLLTSVIRNVKILYAFRYEPEYDVYDRSEGRFTSF